MWRTISLALLFTLAAGCAQLTLLTSEDIAADIENARKEQNYRTARYLIRSVPESHPRYQEIRALAPRLESDISAYEKRTHGEVLSLARAGNWQAAHERLDQALGKLPDSDALAGTQETLAAREQRVEAQASGTLLLAEARWLLAHDLQIRTLENLTSSNARRQHRDITRRRSTLAQELGLLGQWFAERHDWQRTHDLLKAGRQLAGGSDEASEMERKAKQALTSASYRQHQKAVRAQQEKASQLLASYRESQALADLLTARDYISRHSASLEQLDQEVTQLCQQLLQSGLAEGETLYAQGKYLAARQAWQRVLPISPEHPELNKKLERVGRVLQSLEALQNN